MHQERVVAERHHVFPAFLLHAAAQPLDVRDRSGRDEPVEQFLDRLGERGAPQRHDRARGTEKISEFHRHFVTLSEAKDPGPAS